LGTSASHGAFIAVCFFNVTGVASAGAKTIGGSHTFDAKREQGARSTGQKVKLEIYPLQHIII
jgi:hypothetical protein